MTAFPEVSAGLSATIERQVNEAATARKLGSGTLDVLGTPELVRWMEEAAVAALAGHLPTAFTTVGVAIAMQHTAATPVGLVVQVRAVLSEVQGRRLKFEIVARDEVEEVGRASHERVMVEVERFINQVFKKKPGF